MAIIEALRLPLSEDLSGFIALLQRLQVPCRVSEESGEQVLRVPAETAEQVRELYQRYPRGDGAVVAEQPPRRGGGFVASLRRSPLTAAVLLLTMIAAAITMLGENFETIRWFSFGDFRIDGEYAYFATLEQTLAAGEWWRLVTPIFVHFGFLHLAMNSMWYWELGRRIEYRQGALMLLGLTLVFGVVSNVAQYTYGGPGIFGGLSGVLYGLLGHCWLFQKLSPDEAYRLPPGVVVLMLVWLVVCLTGVIEVVSFGALAIANAAHVGGLVAGCLTGVLGGLLSRRRAVRMGD
ncbi:rhomboid family intramembrane serine protease [Pseudomonas sp. Choline-3u-10]|jgi:GlpG protein|uniref:rhomboid family intramembrane serine protease n=1 Tax=Pseudomonadaceae TaxID=135621 RepID=UPI0006180A15|nr:MULTISPECIES: rhomboid family intramembrane serine protease [Pseudomonadaceae]AZZ45903.1 rhomboid family intramembrane serine protease [Pseudomonadaceae bacterium SI-3]MBU0949804.1 rhomboid family intramembrane serine protease [Gammaproteobacteria bacterium]HBM06740.1 rhomboid family intramembrane serine protease [Pseudomonas sp.]KJJ63739.1 peptidase S54 [Pseudomonas sp. 10B238]MBK3795142.1 rhomboid family intramembrane serine protease [Stutzerimonas stutzeri]